MRTIYVSPSDMSWLYDRCRRCWRRKIDGIKMDAERLPAVFDAIDGGMKRGITLELLQAHEIPAVRFIDKERVKSAPVRCGDIEIVVSGYLDRLVLLDDGTHGIVDFKTTAPKTDNFTRYWRQLSGYQFAVEEPGAGEPREVSRLDLIVFNPLRGSFKFDPGFNRAAQTGMLERIEIEVNRGKFARLLEDMARVAAAPELPESGRWCETCKALGLAAEMEAQMQAVAA